MSSGFVTESEIAEAKQKRQDEWEKVRQADDPIEAPEQPYDSRSLYERLQEQKQKKELEYEEAHKLKNMIKGLDDDEIEFLDLVDRTKLAADRRKNLEEEKELNDYRNRVATLHEQSYDQKLQAEINKGKPKTGTSNRPSQTKLLKGVIVTKNDNKKRKNSADMEDSEGSKKAKTEQQSVSSSNGHSKVNNTGDPGEIGDTMEKKTDAKSTTDSGLVCVGILPGLGCYEESSSDDCSSNSDQESPISSVRLDLLGRKITKKDKETRKYTSKVTSKVTGSYSLYKVRKILRSVY